MANLAAMFFEKAVSTPDKTAIWCDGKTITYKELMRLVQRQAAIFSQNGVAYRDHIGFPMNNSIESVAIMFAAASMGVALVPVSPSLPFPAVKQAFKVGNVKHVVAREVFIQSNEAALKDVYSGTIFCLDGEYEGAVSLKNIDAVECFNANVNVTGDETFIICLTSGSTGAPKPINLTQNNKDLRAMAHIKLYKLTENDNILAATPLYHSLAERLVIMPLILGGTSILLPRFTPNIWLNCVKEQNVSFTIAVSSQLSQVAELLSSPFAPELTHLRSVVSSSALLEPHIRSELIQKLKCEFHEMYGTSELSTVTNIHFQQHPGKKKSVGKPLPEAEIRIVLPEGRIANPHEIGEIECKSSLLCNGYVGQESLFNEQLHDGYFKTGDLGYVDEDGFLYFSGRGKDLIITGGINVYPQDVEECVAALPEVSECSAFAYPDDRLVEVVALAVVLKQGCQLSKRAVQVQCARNLADFQQPHKIFFLEGLPKNAMGKIMKSKILEHIKLKGLE